jgi:hypothetical protein
MVSFVQPKGFLESYISLLVHESVENGSRRSGMHLIPKVNTDNSKSISRQDRVRIKILISLRSCTNPRRPLRRHGIVSPLTRNGHIHCRWWEGIYRTGMLIPDNSTGLAEAFHSTVGILEIVGDFSIGNEPNCTSTTSPVKIVNVLLGTRDSMAAYKISSRVRGEPQVCSPYAPVG